MFHVEHSITMHKYAKIMYKYTERKGQAAGSLPVGACRQVSCMAVRAFASLPRRFSLIGRCVLVRRTGSAGSARAPPCARFRPL